MFDEIDAGIRDKIFLAVGEKLKKFPA